LGHGAVSMGAVSAHLGRLASLAGERAEADEFFDKGIEMNRRAGAAVWIARGLHDQGVELLHWKEFPAARAKLRAGSEIAASVGMPHLQLRFGRELVRSREA
jgi:hypothetical protein